ncbi:pilus assembly protein TadG-related protein [Mesobacillus harenae]|uniref:pilus assembly protein TadG-related protein n=1 Tax=Mesobacillus harenae TaxID=2213203 RepID=UPI001F55528E|nr:Tad domain-containing protein [Mesobacillus harenae]
MSRIVKKLLNRQQGNVLLLFSLALMCLMGMAGLALDGSLIYMTKSHLQKTANAAVLSGAQELTNQEAKVTVVVNDILASHGEADSLQSLGIEMEKRVEVSLSKPISLNFMRLFGFDTINVPADASAELNAMGRAAGAAPLGIDERITLEYYTPYQLKVDSSDVDTGNFGILALGVPGANTYEDNLRFGYKDELRVNDVIDTQTGNIADKTRSSIQERINGCSLTYEQAIDRECSRVILIPVYKPYLQDSNQLKSIQITGFAYFYITDPMSHNDTSIKGMFIKKTGTGYQEDGSVLRGAYSIRLAR